MPTFSLPYGKTKLSFTLPDSVQVDTLLPPKAIPPAPPETLIANALQNPAAEAQVRVKGGRLTAAIAINDKTRPVPHQLLLPPLLKWLESLGILPEQIHFYIATGTHTPTPPEEFHRIAPEAIIQRYSIESHDCDCAENLTFLGDTQAGTPIYVNRKYYQAQLKIVVGNLEPHHFMGFSGGVKSASIGLCGRETINRNHAFLTHPNARAGIYEENPMRQDIEEIGERIGIDLALNTVMNVQKEIIAVLFDNPKAVMRAGIPLSLQATQVQLTEPYDLVIASVGGAPKDLNLYQSQKALTHASMVVRDGGMVILAAECGEGSGSASFEKFMEDVDTYQEAIAKFTREGFRVGPHKAFQIAQQAARSQIYLVSEMPKELTTRFLLHPAESLQSAVNLGIQQLPATARIAVMPYATNTLPIQAP